MVLELACGSRASPIPASIHPSPGTRARRGTQRPGTRTPFRHGTGQHGSLEIPGQPGRSETDRALSDLPRPSRGPARPSRRHRDLSLVLSAAAATASGTGSGSGESIAGAAWDTGTGSPGAPSPDTGRSPYSAWVASPGPGAGSAGPARALSRSPSPAGQRLPLPGFPPRRRHGPSPVPSQPYVCHRSGWRWCPGRCSAAPAAPSSPASSRPTGRAPRGCLPRPRPLRRAAG